MAGNLGHVSGGGYKIQETLERARFEQQGRHLYIGQRDAGSASSAAILLGKVYERVTAQDFFDANVWLDVAFPHVVFIAGKRGTGKSYDLGIIAEGLAAEAESNFALLRGGFATVIFDLQSQFWTMGGQLNASLAEDAAQMASIRQWKLQGKVKKPDLFVPRGSLHVTNTEIDFVVPPESLELADWLSLAGVERFDPMGQLLRVALQVVVKNKPSFELADLRRLLKLNMEPELHDFQQSTVDALSWRLTAIEDIDLFRPGTTIVDALLVPGKTSIIMLREIDDAVKAVVVATTMRHIERAMSAHHQRLKAAKRGFGVAEGSELPSRAWVLIDEAHLVCPNSVATSARPVVVDYVKRGRDAGLSLVLATQQPSALDVAAISQTDLAIIHRLTIDADISAALQRLPAPLPRSVSIAGRDVSDPRVLVRHLQSGESLVADAEASRSFVMRSRPRVSPHGGGEPTLQ